MTHRDPVPVSARLRAFAFLFALAALLAVSGLAQESAALSGAISDPSRALVPGAEVTLTNLRTGATFQTVTNEVGMYLFGVLAPGDYTLAVTKKGFSKVTFDLIRLAARDRQSINVDLKVSESEGQTIEVKGQVFGVSADTSEGSNLEQEYSENLPLNGRSTLSLVTMAPGVANVMGGELNVNGLRGDTNYYTMDGLSMTDSQSSRGGGGGGGGGPMGPMGGGGGAPMGGGGGNPTDGIALDSLREVRVQTSTFAPEFGRTPGAQIALTSRSGSNGIHGSLSEYYRNDSFNANEWMANSGGLARGYMSQNRFGGTVSGNIIRNRTFFFGAFEGLRLEAPYTVVASVPSLATRASIKASLKPFVNVFPIPNGAALLDGAARFTSVVVNPSNSNSPSLRIDHSLNSRNALFLRYGYTATDGVSRGTEMSIPNVISSRDSANHSLTGALTSTLNPLVTNDLRINLTRSSNSGTSTMDNYGGGVPLNGSLVFPQGVTTNNGAFSLSMMGTGSYSLGGKSGGHQTQANLVEGLSMVAGTHTYKIGGDVRYVAATNLNLFYNQSVNFNGLTAGDYSMVAGLPLSAMVSTSVPATYPTYLNYSTYVQDTFRATPRITLTYGLRWDINPAPFARSGPRPYAVRDASMTGLTQLRPLYAVRWGDIAIRLGLAVQLSAKPNHEMTLRMGWGGFHDVGYGSSFAAFSGAPYSNTKIITEPETFPLIASDSAGGALPPKMPFGMISAADPNLMSPMTYQKSITLERYFGRNQMLSIGYVGTSASRLLRSSMTPSYTAGYDILNYAVNSSSSNYNGMQTQFRRRLSKGLQTQVSWTWSHALDSSSDGGGGGFGTTGGSEMGNSSYDVRHVVSVSGSYNFPAPREKYLRALLGGWYTDFVLSARTGLPFDIVGVSTDTSDSTANGLFAQVRPDYTGEPIWLTDSHAPGGKRLNPAAFSIPDTYSQGNLGRNVLRGFSAWQTDMSLRRQFTVTERLRLNLAAQAYNILNHPSFADPSRNEGANMSSPEFGIATRTLSQGFGGGGGSFSRIGGPRNLEFSLRLQF